jgi:antitoxin CcdA
MDARSPRRRKKAANLSIDAELLKEAKTLGINISQFAEEKLAEEVRRRRWEAWRNENRAAIEAYNRHIERDGIFGEEYRRF